MNVTLHIFQFLAIYSKPVTLHLVNEYELQVLTYWILHFCIHP